MTENSRHLYIDTSAFLAVALSQTEGHMIYKIISRASTVLSSDLLVSEACAAFKREVQELPLLRRLLDKVTLLSPTISFDLAEKIFQHGYLRGADAHHLACALWFCENEPNLLQFLSLDQNQVNIAAKLGFSIPK